MDKKNYFIGEYEIEQGSDELLITEKPCIILSDQYMVDQNNYDHDFTEVSHVDLGLQEAEQVVGVLRQYKDFIYSAKKEIMEIYLKEYKLHMKYNYNTDPKKLKIVDSDYLNKVDVYKCKIRVVANPICDWYIIVINT